MFSFKSPAKTQFCFFSANFVSLSLSLLLFKYIYTILTLSPKLKLACFSADISMMIFFNLQDTGNGSTNQISVIITVVAVGIVVALVVLYNF